MSPFLFPLNLQGSDLTSKAVASKTHDHTQLNMAEASYDETGSSLPITVVESASSIGQTLEQTLVLRRDTPAKNLNAALERLALANRPASEFDNFYTPKNEEFYSKAPYFKLDEARHEIRLLKVYPEKKRYSQHLTEHPEWENNRLREEDNAGRRKDNKSRRTNYEIRAREQQSIIACELVDTIPLSRVDGTYHALSYCAGSPKNISSILVNGIFFNAFANLEHAIESTLDFWNIKNPGKDLMLWVDQICINQDDQAERSIQVRLMQDIYRRSKDAIICISIDKSTTPRDPYDAQIPDSSEATMWLQHALRSQEQSSSTSNLFHDIDIFVRDKIQSNDYTALSSLPACFNSMCTFLSSPWWSRAWVYQEFIMAPRAYFIYRTDTVDSISWAELSLMFEKVFSLKEKTLDDLGTDILDWIKVRKEEVQTEVALLEREKARQTAEWNAKNRPPILKEIESLTAQKFSLQARLDENLKQQRRKLFRKSLDSLTSDEKKYKHEIRTIQIELQQLDRRLIPDIVNPRREQLEDIQVILNTLYAAQTSIEEVKQLLPKIRSCMAPVTSLVKGKSTQRRVFGLKEVLDHSRRCQASDPRDKIYAFLGLADKGYGIIPNYSWENTVIHLLLHTAQKIIAFEGSLDILEHVRHGREQLGHLLPSWVPDWTSNDLQLFADQFQERVTQIRNQDGNNNPFQASKTEVAKPEFVKDQSDECILDMRVNGIFMELLENMEGSPYDESALQTFLTQSGLRVHTSQVAACGDEVWIIYGARFPMVLRSEQSDRYSFISQALICESNGKISDIMFGSKMVDVEANMKNITIV